jgi:hypothetical protein
MIDCVSFVYSYIANKGLISLYDMATVGKMCQESRVYAY